MIRYENKKNILQSDSSVIVNPVGIEDQLDVGLRFRVKRRFPSVFEEYIDFVKTQQPVLGKCQLVNIKDTDKYIANLFIISHTTSEKRKIFTQSALKSLEQQMIDRRIRTVSFPYGLELPDIDWDVIYGYINTLFGINPFFIADCYKIY